MKYDAIFHLLIIFLIMFVCYIVINTIGEDNHIIGIKKQIIIIYK